MAPTPRIPPFATWLTEQPDSLIDRALGNPAALGRGADLIGFGGGQPAVECYPRAALARAFSNAILEDGAASLPYGPTEGIAALREIVARRLAQRGINVGSEHVLITTGSVQGLLLIGRVLLDQGDVVLTEAPTFMGALAAWETQQPRFVSIPVDQDGLRVDILAETLRTEAIRPKFLYLLPTFQNPSGVSLSLARRQRLLEVAEQHDFLIVEDDPYGELWFDGDTEPIPPLRSLPGAEERVVYVGTFSKILAPGLRLAFTVAPTELIKVMVRTKRGVDFHTDGLVQHGVVRLLSDPAFDLEAHIRAARQVYKQRRDAMLDALETTFEPSSTWTRPMGGFFLWLELPAAAERVVAAAQAEGVAVMSGELFYANQDGGKNAIRLSFSNADPERIRVGVARLKRALTA